MLLKDAVGHLCLALAALTEALDVAIRSDAPLQQLQRATTCHAAVLHMLACTHIAAQHSAAGSQHP
jgi:hypothetical protein